MRQLLQKKTRDLDMQTEDLTTKKTLQPQEVVIHQLARLQLAHQTLEPGVISLAVVLHTANLQKKFVRVLVMPLATHLVMAPVMAHVMVQEAGDSFTFTLFSV